MALTIYNTPYSYAPAYNQMIFTLSSTNYSQPNFRYFADIYVNGGSEYTRLSCVANPSNNYGVFDVAGIIQTFLTRDANDNTLKFNVCENSIVSYEVKFGEQYGVTSGITNYPNLTSSSGYAYNGVFDPLSFLDYDVNKYVLYNSSTIFLTDTPRLVARETEELNIGFMADVTQFSLMLMRIRAYTSNGTLQKTVYLRNTTLTNLTKNRSINANIGFSFIGNLTNADLYSGTAPVIDEDTSYYTITMFDVTEVLGYRQKSEERFIYIEDYCSKYDPIRFKFMNNYGKYDYFTFTLAKTKNTEIKRNLFKQNPNQWNSTNYNYNRMSRGSSQYETILNDTITIQSDWITEDESVWLEQLMSSPDVYIYNNDELVAVNITNSSYQTKYEKSEQLFNLSISFQYSQNRKRQRR